MSEPDQRAATIELVTAVLELIRMPPSDQRYREHAHSVLDLCEAALTVEALQVEVRTKPVDLGLRIAELRASAMGVREIARRLGVNASTVSRRLRKAVRTEPVA